MILIHSIQMDGWMDAKQEDGEKRGKECEVEKKNGGCLFQVFCIF